MTSRTEYRVVAVTTDGRLWPMPTVREPPIDNPGSAEARRDWMLAPKNRPLWLEDAFIEERGVIEGPWRRVGGAGMAENGPESNAEPFVGVVAGTARVTNPRTRGQALTLLAVVGLLLLAGCAESTATVEATDPWETKRIDPQFARNAEVALEAAPSPENGWRSGIVLAEDEKDRAYAVLSDDGMVYLEASWDQCKGQDGYAWDELPLLVDPGDLITWTGDDRELKLCEVRVVKKAAA